MKHEFPLIDREAELAELTAALESAARGSGRVVLLAGEPGIGKTRLASALGAEAERRGVPVWWGRGWEDGSAPAFWPWNSALRRWIERVDAAELATAVGPFGAELANVFPALRDRLPDLAAGDGSESERARFRIFDLVSRFLAAVAKPAGLVIVLDDLHWADRSTLKLLEFVAADLADARLLVVATYRDTEVGADDPLAATLSCLARESSTRRIMLGGLSPEQCARWLASTAPHRDVAALGAALHQETNGNPFLVGEVAHLLAAEERIESVPHGVREVVGRRLARLGYDCRATLAVAAVSGDAIDPALLEHVLDGVTPSDHLAAAVRDRILVEAEGGRRRYRFAHALIRRVLVDDLAPSVRSQLHAHIANVIERHGSAGTMTTEIVYHLAAAGTDETLRKAFDYACRGADQAARGLGWEEAVRLYGIALDVGARSGLVDAAQVVELELALARALRGAGDVPAARERCERVMDACRRDPDPMAFARAALIFAGPLPEWGRMEPTVRAVLEEAYLSAAAIDDALRARLLARLAGDLIATNTVEQGERIFALCEEAATAARRSGASGALAIALMGTHYVTRLGMRPARPGERMPTFEEILAAAEAGGEHEYAAAVRYSRAMNLLSKGEPEAFSSEIDGLATAASASRAPDGLWLTDALASLRACLQGRFAAAEEARERALATGLRMQLANALGVYVSQRIMFHALSGRLGEIAGELEVFVDAHPFGARWRPFRALARLQTGNAVDARAEYESMLAAGLEPAERGVMSRTYLAGLAALCVALRDREHAATLYERIARRDDVWQMDGAHSLGPWALFLGPLARLCGKKAAAVGHFETAIQVARRMGSPLIVARAQSRLASLMLSMKPDAAKRERIAAMLAEAGQCAAELGLADVSARVARLEAGLTSAPAPVAETVTTVTEGNVFRQEGEVWTVRYEGKDVRLKDGKGPRYLAALLAAPGRELHVLQFVASAPEARRGIREEGLSIAASTSVAPSDDAPDEQARRAYKARLDDLRSELEEAEEFADVGRAERLREEIEQLVSQLAGQFGRRAPRQGPSETARKAVTKVIRTQIGKLLEMHPALGRHLSATIRMGTVCVYAPADAVAWDVGIGTTQSRLRMTLAARPAARSRASRAPLALALAQEAR